MKIKFLITLHMLNLLQINVWNFVKLEIFNPILLDNAVRS